MTANLYPPSTTNPADSATPERTIALDTRGTILPGVNLVMANLQKLYPRRIFPDTGPVTQQRLQQLCPVGWRRGGTSPSGASLGGTPGGNYFVGNPEKFLNDAAPQRIVWELPGPGEEDWAIPQMMGPFVDPSVRPLPQLLTPQDPQTGAQYRQMGQFASAPFATRVIPMKIHCWGNDLDDAEELAHWVGAAVQVSFNGNLGIAGVPLLGPSGWVEDEKGTRGIHWVVTARFAAPVHYPYFGEREALAVGLSVVGAAPYKVVTE